MGYVIAWERRRALLSVLVPVLVPASLILLALRLLTAPQDAAVINGELVTPVPEGLAGLCTGPPVRVGIPPQVAVEIGERLDFPLSGIESHIMIGEGDARGLVRERPPPAQVVAGYIHGFEEQPRGHDSH